MKSVTQKKTVLMAEDEENDVFMMQRAIRKMNEPVSLQVAKDGDQAIEYLSGYGQYADRNRYPLPALILLDVKMPRKNGFEVLGWLKADGTLTHIPVVMVTSSKVKSDVQKARELGASQYLVKPVPLDELQQLFTETEVFLTVPA